MIDRTAAPSHAIVAAPWHMLLAATLFLATFLGGPFPHVLADSPYAHSVSIHLFWAHGCYHCEQEKLFLDMLQTKYPQIRVHLYEVTAEPENLALLRRVGEELRINISGVPVTIIGDRAFIGWYDPTTTGTAIEKAVRAGLEQPLPDVVTTLRLPPPVSNAEGVSILPDTLILPVVGEISIKHLSLPALTILIAALDGFNPCAMWVLVFLIGLLLNLKDRFKMWVLGSTFIMTSAFIYFLFMTAWLNLLQFLGLVLWVRLAIGLIALIAGGYNLKEYFANPSGVCKVTGNARRQRVFGRLQAIVHQKNFWLALVGIIVLAFAVNLVELVCSASLPVVYIQVLTLTPLLQWQYYLYLLLYITIFMLDDLIIYIAAMTTLQAAGVTGKYSRGSHLVGGVVMLAMGAVILMRPQWLVFG